MFFVLMFFRVFGVMGGVISLEILFFIFAAVEVIPDFRFGHVGEMLLFTLPRIFTSGTFHKKTFW
jgi:hypothetical protein